MDMNSVSTLFRNDRAIPSFAQCFHILLVVHNVASLMFLASRFQKQQYQVTTAESASGALAIMEKRSSNFDIVIADLDMPGMSIYEFVRKVHHQSMTTPVILIAEDVTIELAREAMRNGVCFLFSKPPSDGDIVSAWQHVCRVTGELPALTDITGSVGGEECGNPGSGSSCGGAAINGNLRMEKNIINSEEENSTDDDIGCNPKKSRMTSTASPRRKLEAINILGEHRAHPNSILGMMEKPGLTNIQVSGHLQKNGKRQRLHLNPQETALPVVQAVLPTAQLSNFMKEQTPESDTANADNMATEGALQIPRSTIWPSAPKFAGYTIEYVKQKLDALNYPDNNIRKPISNNGTVQGEGNKGVQIAQCIDPEHKCYANGNSSAHMTNGFQAVNMEPTGVQVGEGYGGKRDEGTDKNCYSTENAYVREQAPLVRQVFSTGIQASAQLTNDLQDPNQDPTGDFKTGTLGFGNAGDLVNMSHANIGGDNSGADQQYFSELSGDDDIKKAIQELVASDVNLSDLFY